MTGGKTSLAKRFTRYLANEKGLTLLEVLISGVIFAFVLLSFGYMFAIAQGLLGGEGERRMALTLAQEAIEFREARAVTTAGFFELEDSVSTGGGIATAPETPVQANQPPYFTANNYNNHQRVTTIVYVDDSNYDTVLTSPTTSNSLRITVTVSPSGSRPVEFGPVSLVTVVTRP